ncbi:MAG: glutamate racemase [Firmicutes bacterium]|nr:glutamate racemase [Bacillota bacterium]
MDNRPIGFFDSGIGGVTSIPYIMKMLPNERIVFYGDTARTPYGSKSPDTIREFSLQIADFLVKKNVKMIVIACNTVSSVAVPMLREKYPDIPIIGCITPTAKEVSKISKPNANIGIIATRGTVNAGVYQQKIEEMRSDVKVFSKACPALVPLIEEGLIDHEIMDMTTKYYLEGFVEENQIDTLVLGCTHYPLIKRSIQKLYPDLEIFSSSKEVAKAVELELEARDMLADQKEGKDEFYASDLSETFVTLIEKILGQEKDELKIGFEDLDIGE